MQVTAAKGAEKFYQTSNNAVRSEGIVEAIERDSKAAQVRGKGRKRKREGIESKINTFCCHDDHFYYHYDIFFSWARALNNYSIFNALFFYYRLGLVIHIVMLLITVLILRVK